MPIQIRLTIVAALLCFSSQTAFSQKPELYVQAGHSDYVRSVAFSSDGKLLASGSTDLKLKLWEVATGKELKTFVGHLASVVAIAFSQDSKTLASIGKLEERIKIWDVTTGKELRTIKGVSGDVRSIQFSPNGRSLASGSHDGTIRLWDIATGSELKIFQTEAEGGDVSSVAFSSDGKILASIESGDMIELWEVATGKKLRELPISGESSDGLLVFSRDGKTLSSFTEGTITLWDVASGKQLSSSAIGVKRPSDQVALSPDAKFLARVGLQEGDRDFKLLEVATAKEFKPPHVSEDGYSVESLAFSPDGAILAIGDDVGAITLWDVFNGKELRSLKGHSSPINSVAFSPDGKVIASGSEDKTVKLWNKSAWGLTVLTGHSKQVRSVAFSPDGRILASGSEDFTIKLWDVAAAKELKTLQGSKSSLEGFMAVAFSPDGKTLAGLEGDIHLWDVSSGQEIKVLKLSGEAGFTVSFSPDGQALACGDDRTVKLWEVATGKELKTLTGHSDRVGSVVFSPDRKTLASSGADGTIKLWDVTTGRELQILRGHSNPVYTVAFSPNGKMLASSSIDQTVRLWDAATGRELKNITLNSDIAALVTFSPDSKTLASGSLSGRTYLWDVRSGVSLASLIALDEKDWVVTTPDGRFDGSPEGMKLLHYVQNNKAIPLDSFFEQFYAPKLLAQVISGDLATTNLPIADISKAIKLPPLVKITSPKAGESFNADTVQISVEATDQGGGVDEIRLYQNGKLVSDETRQLVQTAANNKTFSVTLVPGINIFRATAFNKDRTESNPAEIKIELKAAQASSDLYILAIGLNEYKNSKYNLNYGRADAQAFADAVEQRGRNIFRRISKQIIFDDQATRQGIEEAFNQIIVQAKPQDAFVFYFAGHGVMSEGDDKTPAEFYLVPYDVVRLYGDDGALSSNGVAARLLKDLCTKVRAQKQLIVLDSCQSAGALEAFAVRGAAEEKAVLQLARSAGVVVLAATGQDQVASEFGKLGHGVFTYALLQAMGGEADGSPPDGKVTVSELVAYINDRVPELTKQYRGKTQYPNAWARGQDFPLGVK
jgi:WD40 repeat protein